MEWDGNPLEIEVVPLYLCQHLRTRTPQGDGNQLRCMILIRHQHHLRTRTPQGDGNHECREWIADRAPLFKNQNPARGRKLLHLLCLMSYRDTFKNQNPARGRKLLNCTLNNVRIV